MSDFYCQRFRDHHSTIRSIADKNLELGVFDFFDKQQLARFSVVARDIIKAFREGWFKDPGLCEAIGEWLWMNYMVGERDHSSHFSLLNSELRKWWYGLAKTSQFHHEVEGRRVTIKGGIERSFEETRDLADLVYAIAGGGTCEELAIKEHLQKLKAAISRASTDAPETITDLFVAACAYSCVDRRYDTVISRIIEAWDPYDIDWDAMEVLVAELKEGHVKGSSKPGQSLEDLEADTPPLDTASVDWIEATQKNIEILKIKISSLRRYRTSSLKGRSLGPYFGVDKYGRRWRKDPNRTEGSNVFYWRPSLPPSVD
ncbi:hypothetical protein [Rosistilla oblonga]|uniref:Uncharacterized protein n=1 Tax=Rosistilla oblonga TaxID=2527990 RepID=A0A518IQW3_9BACT|nr:hypothetical protein [Rosistilla oblonga]QDV55486.1 hypothetical protein Mal33_14610 [Rosistilla oblonga]